MEDLRDARNTVSEFAALIDHLRPNADISRHRREQADVPVTRRQNSTGSSKSAKGSISSRWRSKTLKKDWDETTEGILWNELEQSQNEVAHQFKLDKTALKEFISCPTMMDLGCEFTRHFHGDPIKEKPDWVAEDLFFELQAVKQGDTPGARWAAAKVYKKEWDLADHLARFVLLAEQCRICSGQEKWMAWQWNFAGTVCFHLSVLRCYTVRDAKQRELARMAASCSSLSPCSTSAPSPLHAQNSKGRKDERSPRTHYFERRHGRETAGC
ncbi:hypothetical protein NPX13_g7352 [Xylaria arbuscula]|uniref:Uncharacterized protein n=1 Tax=Xylaria arbuscula TaxID=114810 RepID=A0A9W8TKI6_9PEZI|nr:hypothetical protein NPX13_g7352 [Xylaria arbuscula]